MQKEESVMNTDLTKILHRYIDEYGYSWSTVRQVVNRMLGRQYTMEELWSAYLIK